MAKHVKQPVNFRLGHAYIKALEQRGQELGISRHEYARHIITRCLNDENHQELRQELNDIRTHVKILRKEIRDVLELLLLKLEPDASPEEISEYVSGELGPIE